jgi:hypothetical protein
LRERWRKHHVFLSWFLSGHRVFNAGKKNFLPGNSMKPQPLNAGPVQNRTILRRFILTYDLSYGYFKPMRESLQDQRGEAIGPNDHAGRHEGKAIVIKLSRREAQVVALYLELGRLRPVTEQRHGWYPGNASI